MSAAHMHLLRAMIDLHLMVRERLDIVDSGLPSPVTIRTKLSNDINDICGSFPCLLGYFYAGVAGTSAGSDVYASGSSSSTDATGAMWMLHKVLCVPGLSPAVKRWGLGVFERLGTDGNIRQSLNLRDLYAQGRPELTQPVSIAANS